MSSPAPQPPPEAFFTEQVINLTVWNGTAVTTVPLPLPFLTYMFHYGYSVCISYGTQLGACIVMLLVALTMTPRIKFARVTTLINIASLLVGIVRITLLATYFVGDSTDFYNLFSGDYRYVNPAETARNVAATSMAVPQLVLILAALIIQAWSMMKLWEPIYRWVAMAVSTVLAVVTLAFKITSTVIQARYIEHAIDDLDPYVWVRKVDLSMYATSIAWFCFMFNVRLIVHMWEHRKFLPSSKGLNPMEVLVMTNGILMLVPVVFAGLEFATFSRFEAGSWTSTSVIIVLPLGTLVAQRIAAPSAFTSLEADNSRGSSRSKGMGGGSTSAGSEVPFLRGWRRGGSSGRGSSSAGGGATMTGVTSQVSSGGGSSAVRHMDPIDAELARIENEQDLEKGQVRVEREIERREERL